MPEELTNNDVNEKKKNKFKPSDSRSIKETYYTVMNKATHWLDRFTDSLSLSLLSIKNYVIEKRVSACVLAFHDLKSF